MTLTIHSDVSSAALMDEPPRVNSYLKMWFLEFAGSDVGLAIFSAVVVRGDY